MGPNDPAQTPSPMRAVLLFLILGPVTVLVAAWAVAPPDSDDPLSLAAKAARPALARVGAWYRADPGDDAPDWRAASLVVPGGDPARAPAVMAEHGCGTCHVLPGLPGADGSVGPPLTGFARRAYVAGIVPNRPGPLIDWLLDPAALAPETAMPNVGLDEAEARDIAAWLYTLR